MCGRWPVVIGSLLLLILSSNTVAVPMDFKNSPSKSAQMLQQQLDAAKLYLIKRDLVNARRMFLLVLEHDSTQIDAIAGMIDVELAENNPEEARNWLQKAEKIVSNSARMELAKGRFYLATKDIKKAEESFLAAISMDSGLFAPHLELGSIYSHQNRLKESEERLTAAIEINPSHAGAHYALGVTLARQGINELAINMFTRSIELAPKNPLPRLALAQLWLASKKIESAQKEYQKLLQDFPKLAVARIGLGDSLVQKKQFQEAEKEYKKATDMAPGNADAHTRLGDLYQITKRWKDARSSYLKALEINKSARILNNLSWVTLMTESDMEQAITWGKQAVKMAPSVPYYQDTLAWAYHKTGNSEKAVVMLQKLVEKHPTITSFKTHLDIVNATLQEK